MTTLSTRYSDEQVSRFRTIAGDARRHLLWAAPAVVGFIVYLLPILDNFKIPVVIVLACGALVGAAIFRAPKSALAQHDAALAAWTDVVIRSDPGFSPAVHFPLRAGEAIHYSERSQRFEERRTGQVINTQSRTKNAVGSAVVGGVLFGPAGAIIGGGMARRQTTGTATDVYDVVPVDEGDIAFTSQRFVFMGARDTIEIPFDKIMRITSLDGTNRIVVEYPGRVPGESYTVVPDLFAMCMARRARRRGFVVPDPPPPLAMTHAVQPIAATTPAITP